MPISWPPKDPDEVLDYGVVWSRRLPAGDTIVATTAVVESGSIVVDKHEAADLPRYIAGQSTVTWLSGGAAGQSALLRLRIVTEQGRTLEESVSITLAER